MIKIRFLLITIFAALLPGFLAERHANAHPMGNFSINHYARITIVGNQLTLRYVLDMAEIPTVTERSAMDRNADGKISEEEQKAYLTAKVRQLRAGLTLNVNNHPPEWTMANPELEFKPGAGGLDTLRIAFSMTAGLLPASQNVWRVSYKDVNFAERTGWKEIVTSASEGSVLLRSTAATNDRSQELTAYPAVPGLTPPQQMEAELTVRADRAAVSAPVGTLARSRSHALPSPPSPHLRGFARTPQDGFTQSIARRELTAGVILLSLGLAFLFGAFHALSPGHGKAMVAAYLVGSRGTIRHALFLGGVITLTHTLSVFALGLITLAATQYVVPERLYPIVSLGSGILIAGVGAALLWQRAAAAFAERREGGEGYGRDAFDGEEISDSPLPETTTVSLPSLLALGITGGALPCPSALVVMLGAIALHRIALGLALIAAFSLGLAFVLTGIGVLVVRLRRLLDRLPLHRSLTSRLPLVSAALITLVGLFLVVRALQGQS